MCLSSRTTFSPRVLLVMETRTRAILSEDEGRPAAVFGCLDGGGGGDGGGLETVAGGGSTGSASQSKWLFGGGGPTLKRTLGGSTGGSSTGAGTGAGGGVVFTVILGGLLPFRASPPPPLIFRFCGFDDAGGSTTASFYLIVPSGFGVCNPQSFAQTFKIAFRKMQS
jgi:hypothetical protein